MTMQVAVSTLDVAKAQEAEDLIDQAASAAPLGGIFHLAMTIKDKWLSKQARLFQDQLKDHQLML